MDYGTSLPKSRLTEEDSLDHDDGERQVKREAFEVDQSMTHNGGDMSKDSFYEIDSD